MFKILLVLALAAIILSSCNVKAGAHWHFDSEVPVVKTEEVLNNA